MKFCEFWGIPCPIWEGLPVVWIYITGAVIKPWPRPNFWLGLWCVWPEVFQAGLEWAGILAFFSLSVGCSYSYWEDAEVSLWFNLTLPDYAGTTQPYACSLENSSISLLAQLPQMPASKAILDSGSKSIETQGINPSQLFALIDPSVQCIGVQLPWSRLAWIQESKVMMLAMYVLL